jgi:hypothetical protein
VEEPQPQQEDTKPGDPPKEDQETGPGGAPEPGDEEQGPSGPPPESIPGDSGEVPNPSQN